MIKTDSTLACDILSALSHAIANATTKLDQEVLADLHKTVTAAMIDADLNTLSPVVMGIVTQHEDDWQD